MVNSNISKEDFIKKNLGLVHSCAHRFKNRGIEYDDLFSTGCIGLVKAFDAFDTLRGVQFSTYAVPVILGEIKRLFRDGGAIKVSRSLKELYLKIRREKELYLKKYLREPTILELSELLNVEPMDIIESLNANHPPVSLTVDEENSNAEIDIKVDAPEDSLSDIISLDEVIKTLSRNDRNLIVLRYFRNNTQTQTAKKLNMTQVQVSRREKKILTTLREKLKN